ncbi:prolipoprotein diacylglyceryl transferase [uncultured Pseudokineococcus sp.]|uniref:prolipoprotein diacylglyceryl transferase n=1 Tax=uncultured Pseudokineococcus sp. TaxID=1642928 RepID=UPI0026367051|nr:prolipoprotein diacylglyceryl transferase [uncultured Pseudokineococcus sp.]
MTGALAAVPGALASVPAAVLTSIPSPAQGVWHLGPVPIRAYALAIILGIVLGVALSERRLRARGGPPGAVVDIAIWAVLFGIVGARVYHVLSSPDAYFGEGGDLVRALYVWEGGLGIWGAIPAGFLGALVPIRQLGLRVGVVADAMAPGLLLAQAVGRVGNYFNQELFGRPTTLPWGLEIDPANRPAGYAEFETFHPTFLYEALWCLVALLLLLLLERVLKLGHGRVFLTYVLLYVIGRGFIETLRIDQAEIIAGLRLNVWTSVVVGLVAVIGLLVSAMRHPGREATALREPPAAEAGSAAEVEALDAGAEPREAAEEGRRAEARAASERPGDGRPQDAGVPAGDGEDPRA